MQKLITYLFLMAILFVGFTSCSDDDDDNNTDDIDYSETLNNTGENVILKTYEDLANRAQALYIATQAFENNSTAGNLEGAKAAWVAARIPWEQSEGFLFGPVDQEGLDPALDSWPVNVTDLDAVLASNNDLTVEFLGQQEGTLKGFHTIEYLLWGENSNKQVSDFTPREYEYLAAAAGALKDDAKKLYDHWRPGAGNYINNVLTAGEGSPVYVSQKSALEEITSAMIIIVDEVGNGKITDPYVQQDLTLEESRFSANSKADFANNMRSIKNIYTAKYGTNGNGKSIGDIIEENSSALHTEVLNKIDVSINKIESIPGTFSDAVFNNRPSVEAAQNAVRDLQSILEEEVLPIISNL